MWQIIAKVAKKVVEQKKQEKRDKDNNRKEAYSEMEKKNDGEEIKPEGLSADPNQPAKPESAQDRADKRKHDRRDPNRFNSISSAVNASSSGSSGYTPFEYAKFSDEDLKYNKEAVNPKAKLKEFFTKIDESGHLNLDSDIGRAAVSDQSVDMKNLSMPILAAQADMFKKIKELEGRIKKRS